MTVDVLTCDVPGCQQMVVLIGRQVSGRCQYHQATVLKPADTPSWAKPLAPPGPAPVVKRTS